MRSSLYVVYTIGWEKQKNIDQERDRTLHTDAPKNLSNFFVFEALAGDGGTVGGKDACASVH